MFGVFKYASYKSNFFFLLLMLRDGTYPSINSFNSDVRSPYPWKHQ